METSAQTLDKEENTKPVLQEDMPQAEVFSSIFPSADAYLIDALAHSSVFTSAQSAREKAQALKEQLNCEGVNADDILINIILCAQSPKAAERKIEVLKSADACLKAAAALSLDGAFTNSLLGAYASLGSRKLFLDEYKEICGAAAPLAFNEDQASPVIDAMLDGLKENEAKNSQIEQDNRAYAQELLAGKKISALVYEDLLDAYGVLGARGLRAAFEEALDMLSSCGAGEKLNYLLAARIALFQITSQEAQNIAKFSKMLKYPLLADDLQKIIFKYLPVQSLEEICVTFETVLKRLFFISSPVENLGYAVKVMTEGNDKVFIQVQKDSALRKDKILYMRSLGAVKSFSGHEDELTSLYHNRLSIAEVMAKYDDILNRLPCKESKDENTDIALKVLLSRLPLKDASSQAQFRCNNKTPKYMTNTLETEAIESYLGTKDREEVLSIIHASLKSFNFWKEDEAKYCYALTLIMGELNGRISPLWRDIGLTLLERGAIESSIEYILKNLSSQSDIDYQALLNAYERFYSITKDHQDTAMRVVNMLQ